MPKNLYVGLLLLIGVGFAVAFAALCVPPLLDDPDVLGAFAAGFVNPYASGYSLDAVCCWIVLAVFVGYERVRWGWAALIVGIVPGVATGFALYLLLRLRDPDRVSR